MSNLDSKAAVGDAGRQLGTLASDPREALHYSAQL